MPKRYHWKHVNSTHSWMCALMLSHVNDGGFWLFKEYFNLSIRETLRTWTVMETLVGIIGITGVLIMNQIL